MKFKVVTLFPDFVKQLKNYSIIGRAIRGGKICLETVDIRDYGLGNYKQVDDRPYGGGIGMLLRVDVLYRAIKKAAPRKSKSRIVIMLDAAGEKYTQQTAKDLTKYDEIILVCGHYEGFDKRIENYVDKKISIGEYIITGGELPAMAIIDSTCRLLPGVLGKDESSQFETFSFINGKRIVENPQFTRPSEFKGEKVPEVLISGNHKKINSWIKKHTKQVPLD